MMLELNLVAYSNNKNKFKYIVMLAKCQNSLGSVFGLPSPPSQIHNPPPLIWPRIDLWPLFPIHT